MIKLVTGDRHMSCVPQHLNKETVMGSQSRRLKPLTKFIMNELFNSSNWHRLTINDGLDLMGYTIILRLARSYDVIREFVGGCSTGEEFWEFCLDLTELVWYVLIITSHALASHFSRAGLLMLCVTTTTHSFFDHYILDYIYDANCNASTSYS